MKKDIVKNIFIISLLLSITTLYSCFSNEELSVEFVTPTNGSELDKKDLGVVVEASNSNDTVASVELYINNKLVRNDTISPYQWGTASSSTDHALLNLSNGTYDLRAVATDEKGQSSSAEITVTVNVSATDLCSDYPNPDNSFGEGDVIRNYTIYDKNDKVKKMCELGDGGRYQLLFLATSSSW